MSNYVDELNGKNSSDETEVIHNKKVCNWCGKTISEYEEFIQWEGACFCSNRCLDECRTIQ